MQTWILFAIIIGALVVVGVVVVVVLTRNAHTAQGPQASTPRVIGWASACASVWLWD